MSRPTASLLSFARFKRRLMASVLLAAIPFLVLVGMLTLDRICESRSSLKARNTAAAQRIGLALSSYLDNLRERQALLLDACSLWQAELGWHAHMMEKMLRHLHSHSIVGCSVFGTDGQLLCTAGSSPGYTPLFDISPLQPVMTGNACSVCVIATCPGALQAGANADAGSRAGLDAAPTLVLASRILRERYGPCVLAMEIDLSWMDDTLAATCDDHYDPDVFGVRDPSGQVLLWERSSSAHALQVSAEALRGKWPLVQGADDAVNSAGAVLFTHTSSFGGERVSGSFEVSAVAIPSMGWVSFAATRSDPADAMARDRILMRLLILACAAVAAIASAAFLLHRMSREASALERAAAQVSAGDLSARAGLRSASDIGAAGQAFDEMASTLAELEQSRMHMLQVASHELRNPLAAVKGAASLLKIRLPEGKDSRELMPLVDVILRQSDDLAEKLTRISDALIIAGHQRVMNMKPVELRALTRKALKPFLDSPDGNRLVVRGVGADLPDLMTIGDHDQLEMVAASLISNGLKYSMGRGTIDIVVESRVNNARLTVSDCGIGVPTAELSAIFDGFVRGSNLEGCDPGGLGLGLYVSSMIVKQHGGIIWAESDEGAGTRFHVELPLEPALTGPGSQDRSDLNGQDTRCGGRS